jgi:hypothetical protein
MAHVVVGHAGIFVFAGAYRGGLLQNKLFHEQG